MNALVLQTGARILKPVMLLFSVFLLLRGHNEPGGGFVGGLIAASSFCLHAMALGPASARRSLNLGPETLMGLGLVIAACSGLLAMVFGYPYLTGFWGDVHLPVLGTLKIGTPLVFDIGVYLVVVGVTLHIFMRLMEDD
jgi:multicomponent Na+:H+ antiporter subunit B